MNLNNLKDAYLENLPNDEWETLYYTETEKADRNKLLQIRIAREGNTEELEIISKLFEARYTPVKKEPATIDHMIRACMLIKFLEEETKGRLKSRNKEKKINEIINDLGYNVVSEYGELGKEFLDKELHNMARVYIHLCKSDRHYGSIILGFGKMKPAKLANKIGRDVLELAFRIPVATDTVEHFKDFSRAFTDVFCEEFPDLQNVFVQTAVALRRKEKIEE